MIIGTEPQSTSRRDFTVRAIFGLASVMGLALSAPAAMYVFTRPKSMKETGWVDAGSINDLNFGAPQELPILRIRVDGWKIRTERDTAWVIRNADGTITAFSPQCTHLGCAYHWQERTGSFLCPCHGSAFSLTGAVISGPAPRPLDRYEVKVEGNRLWLGQIQKSGGSNPNG